MSELASDIGPNYEAVVKESKRITPDNAAEVRHLVLQVQDPAFQYIEGQSIGVVVPGPHPSVIPFTFAATPSPMRVHCPWTTASISTSWSGAASISTR